jgi:organic radical activating enzyme
MDKYIIDRYSMMILIKSKTYHEYSYQILPSVTYTNEELFPYEEKSIFNELNTEETQFDVIIIGKKILKQQIDAIKNEILQKKVCKINHIIFEYDEILDDNIEVEINYHTMFINGTHKMRNIQFKLENTGWIET